MKKRRNRHSPEQIVKKLRDADVMLTSGKSLAEVLQAMKFSEATYHRWQEYRRRAAEPGVQRSHLEALASPVRNPRPSERLVVRLQFPGHKA